MQKIFVNLLLAVIVLPLFYGCSHNATDQMRGRFLSPEIQPEKIDFSRGAKCSDTRPILLINGQGNPNKPYVFFENLGHSHYFLESDFVEMVIDDLEMQLTANNITAIPLRDLPIRRLKARLFFLEQLLESGEITRERYERRKRIIENLMMQSAKGQLTIDKLKDKTILVSFEEAYASYFEPEPEIVKIKITIPSRNYVRIYTGNALDWDFYRVIAKAAHAANLQFLNDPVFQEFVKCD